MVAGLSVPASDLESDPRPAICILDGGDADRDDRISHADASHRRIGRRSKVFGIGGTVVDVAVVAGSGNVDSMTIWVNLSFRNQYIEVSKTVLHIYTTLWQRPSYLNESQ